MPSPITISHIEFFPIAPCNGQIAFVSWIITFSEQLKFSVANVAVYTRWGGGFRLVYPARPLPSGKLAHSFRPLTKEAGDLIERAVVEKLETLMRKYNKDVMVSEQCGGTDADSSGVSCHASARSARGIS